MACDKCICDCCGCGNEEDDSYVPPVLASLTPLPTAEEWLSSLDTIFDTFSKGVMINGATLATMVVAEYGKNNATVVANHSYSDLCASLRSAILSSPLFNVKKGIAGGYFRVKDQLSLVSHISPPVSYEQLTKMADQCADQCADTSAAINDYVCPSCRNDRCSKSEGKCWKCEFVFS